MYEDKYPWPFRCPECGEEFTEELGRLKTQTKNVSVKCPGIINRLGPIRCPITIRYSAEEFGLVVAEAEAGRFDPWRKMLRINKPS
jgi:hypothetical protein